MKNNTRIVLIQNHLDDLGGVSRFCSVLAQGLRERNYDVEVVGISPAPEDTGGYFPEEIPTSVLTRDIFPSSVRFDWLAGANRLRRAQKNFTRKLRRAAESKFLEYDENTILIFTQVFAREQLGTVVADAWKSRKVRVIDQYHSSFAAAAETRDLRRVLEAYADGDFFCCLTAEDAKSFQSAGLNNAVFISNPVLPPPPGSSADLSKKIVVSLSRYDPIKQVDHMVSAWELIAEQIPDWKLHLFGGGPNEAALRAQIESANLSSSVKLLGSTRDGTAALLQGSISLNSSRFEGFPLAIGEASALGIPTVAYACSPGVVTLVEDGETGVTAPPNDLTALAQGILKLATDYELRKSLGQAANRHVAQNFALDTILDDWEKLFSSTLR